jgi:3-deoxy-D-manno-octulosonate 8-phosphate phosphatase (KDO 8-P phosphatase)
MSDPSAPGHGIPKTRSVDPAETLNPSSIQPADVANIKLIVFDVDGVLTDGRIIINDQGQESKAFHVRDGFAIRAAQSLGMKIGVITGRASRSVTLRMTELKVDPYLWGIADKAVAFETACQRAGVLPEEAAYVGDDLIDLPAMVRSGYPIAVADAVDEVRGVAKYVTCPAGGRGAARDAIEHILKGQGKWAAFVEKFGI